MGDKERKNNIVSIESFVPKDAMPTARFFSRFPGFDKEYPRFIPVKEGEVSAWTGIAVIEGRKFRVEASHTLHETSILISDEKCREHWVVNERFSDVVTIELVKAFLPISISPDAKIKFISNKYNPQIAARLVFKEENQRFWTGDNKKLPKRPGEFEWVTANQIDYEESQAWGFESVEQAIKALVKLKDVIIRAAPIQTDKPPHIPPSVSLVSPDYFPDSDRF